jgi:hypothetical protein
MKNQNRKGFGLVMAVVVITILLIMASGFVTLTRNATASTSREIEKLRLYWAAESASNYNVNWWVNQPRSVRIDWPSEYDPADAQTTSKSSSIDDKHGVEIPEKLFAKAEGTTSDGLLYLHASSWYEGNTNVGIQDLERDDGIKLITTRYKGERKGRPGEAVWVLDSYAYNTKTGDIANIVLSNVFNLKPDEEIPLLANAEVMLQTMFSAGFNGAIGAFHQKDVRYGPLYYNSLIRLDMQTSGTTGARFFQGPFRSGAFRRASYLLEEGYISSIDPSSRTRWGNNAGYDPGRAMSAEHLYGYGLAIRGTNNLTDEGAAAIFQGIMKGPYVKDAPWINPVGVLADWNYISNPNSGENLYILPSSKLNADLAIRLEYNSGTGKTTAKITGNDGLTTIEIGSGSGQYAGVVVPPNWRKSGNRNYLRPLKISGESNSTFSLVTATCQVVVDGDLFINPLKKTQTYFNNTTDVPNADITQNETKEHVLARMWGDMNELKGNYDSPVITLIAQLTNPTLEPFLINEAPRRFTTAHFVTPRGFLNTSNRTATNNRFFNIGSVIILGEQDAEGGDASGAWTKALIADPRFLDKNMPLPPGIGIPEEEEIISLLTTGLNPQHTWSTATFGRTKNWQQVVWRNGQPSFQ